MNHLSKVLVGALLAVSTVYGAEPKQTTTTGTSNAPATTTGTVAVPTAGSLFGGVDIRPGYRSSVGSFNNEDFAQVGYRFGNANSVYYRQEFSTNIYSPTGNQGLNALMLSGSFRAKVNNIWQDKQAGLSFSIEPRVYVPTEAAKRDNGFITAFRNYFKIRQQLSRTAYLQLSDSPILHVYSRGNGIVRGTPTANPLAENRVLLEAEVELFVPGLTLYLPLELQTIHYHAAGGLKYSRAWNHFLTFWPELTYPVATNVRMGLAFRTENLVTNNLSNTTIGDAFRLGTTQLIFNATL